MNGQTILTPAADLSTILHKGTTAGDQAGGKSVEEMNVLRAKQEFFQNFNTETKKREAESTS